MPKGLGHSVTDQREPSWQSSRYRTVHRRQITIAVVHLDTTIDLH